jgi:hypothetical protein
MLPANPRPMAVIAANIVARIVLSFIQSTLE